ERAAGNAAGRRLPGPVALDVPRPVRTPTSPGSAAYRPLARFRDLRLDRPAHGHETGAAPDWSGRKRRAAAARLVENQSRQKSHGGAGGLYRELVAPARRANRKALRALRKSTARCQRARFRRSTAQDGRTVREG